LLFCFWLTRFRNYLVARDFVKWTDLPHLRWAQAAQFL